MERFPDQFYTESGGLIHVSPSQASRFAKEVAGDWNPIHDVDSRRFCVPGDLLFAIVVSRYGLFRRMHFSFRGMVGEDVSLCLPEGSEGRIDITDASGKVYLQVDRRDESVDEQAVLERFIRCYVAFSGRNFPHFLKPLMAEHGVMFNPQRPLVVYDSMGFELETTRIDGMDMALADSSLEVQGRRGEAVLRFRIDVDGEQVGSGEKRLIISGLRPYDEKQLQDFIAEFTRRIEAYSR